MKRKAVVAMSGGVDSSVAAAMLVAEGYDVTGIMLKLWRGDDINVSSGCCSLGAAEDARRVADTLGIPFYVLNLAEAFEETVIRDFTSTYARGATPNPCVRCNQWIKFDMLLDRARALGADVLATGHYARVRQTPQGPRLLRGADRAKDQSYVLWMLDRDALGSVRFPVGEMTKPQTRALAAELGLRTARKPDSQEICFVRDGDVGGFVRREVPEASRPGPMVDVAGNVVGQHRGVGAYTVGQRRGLGIALGRPVFVTSIDAARNTVTVGTRSDLAVTACELDEISFTGEPLADRAPVLVQHRAHGDVHPAVLTGATLRFDDPVEAVAPGQSAVMYSPGEPDRVLGGGIITATVAASSAA